MTRQDLSIYQGDDYLATVTVSTADGAPADLTGYSASAQIRRKPADFSPEVAAEFLAEIALPQVIILTLTNAQTLALSGVYSWDLQVTDAGGAVQTIMAGQARVTQEVTRAAGAAIAERAAK